MNEVDLQVDKKKKSKKAKEDKKSSKKSKKTSDEEPEEPKKESKHLAEKKAKAEEKIEAKAEDKSEDLFGDAPEPEAPKSLTEKKTDKEETGEEESGAARAQKPSIIHPAKVRMDTEGRFIDEDASSYRRKHQKIKDTVDHDYVNDLRVDGLTLREWELKKVKDMESLEQLKKKREELNEAVKDVEKAQTSLGDERQKID